MRHVAKSSFGQCECYWCGKRPAFTPQCAVTIEIRRAVKKFAAEHGRRWKSILRGHWEKACADISDPDERTLLQLARNIIGPRQLSKITDQMLSRVE